MTAPTVRRVHETAELIDVLDPDDPAAYRLLGDLEERGIGPEVQGWLVEDGDAAPAGAMTVAQLCRGRWYASVMVFDEAAAPSLARVLVASPAWEVSGAADHVQPLMGHLTRLHSVNAVQWLVIPDMHAHELARLLPPPDPRCRLATPDDLDALVDLYATYELEPIPTRRRLRAFLERALAHRPVLVAEEDDRVVGAYRVDFLTPRFAYWTALTVLPEYRRRHLGRALSVGSAYVTRDDLDRGSITTTAPSNPMQLRRRTRLTDYWDTTVADRGWNQNTWVKVRLGPPNRFPGHHLVRRALEVAEGSVRRREKGPDISPAP